MKRDLCIRSDKLVFRMLCWQGLIGGEVTVTSSFKHFPMFPFSERNRAKAFLWEVLGLGFNTHQKSKATSQGTVRRGQKDPRGLPI